METTPEKVQNRYFDCRHYSLCLDNAARRNLLWWQCPSNCPGYEQERLDPEWQKIQAGRLLRLRGEILRSPRPRKQKPIHDGQKVTGAENAARFINEYVLPKIKPANEKLVRVQFIADVLVHEPRETPLDPFVTMVDSLTPQALNIDPDCEWCGYKELSEKTGYSLREVKDRVKSGEWQADWLFGRVYFNPCSFDQLKKKGDS